MAKGGYQKRRIAEKKARERASRKRAARRRKGLTVLASALVLGMIAAVLLTALGGDEPGPVSDDIAGTNEGCDVPGAIGEPREPLDAPPPDVLEEDVNYTATLLTSCGVIKVDLLEDDAPDTVNNFVFLAQEGFYDGTIFHRVIPEFSGSAMIQGGDAVNQDGTGDPGYTIPNENTIPFDRQGLVATANRGPDTNGSQFFILDGTVSHLNNPDPEQSRGEHSVFGVATEGLDVIGRIASVPQDENNRPNVDVILISVTIEEA